MKKILILLIISPSLLYGQVWEKTFGGSLYDDSRSIQQTNDGGYIICGWTHSFGNGNGDVYLIKTNGNGIEQWSQTFGGGDGDGGRNVQQTNDGGYIICGDTESFSNGERDIYIIKTDENGIEEWNNTYGGINNEEGYFIRQTTDGGYIFCGRTESFGNGFVSKPDIYMVKIDENGIEEWYKTYGGLGLEVGYSIQQTTDGGYVICGVTENFNSGNDDVYIIKTDSNGDSLWTKTYGDQINFEGGNTIQQTTDGGYIISGQSNSNINGIINRDILLIKIDENGIEEWYKTYGEINILDFGSSGQQTSDGGYIVTGHKENSNQDIDVYLLKTDEYGDTLWTKKFGGSENDKSYSIHQTTDDGYIICGYSESFNLYPDIYVIKTDLEGNITSSFNISNTSSNKKLKTTVEILGRKIKNQSNSPIIEIYDDGSIIKKIVID
tara:strand:+ start:142 stop:1455 length:1314 start_codon:yes stop_codon:yes gene_type:complete